MMHPSDDQETGNIPYAHMSRDHHARGVASRNAPPSAPPPSTLGPIAFLFGEFFNWIGCVLFFVGAASDQWMVYTKGELLLLREGDLPVLGLPHALSSSDGRLAHMGPWRACTHGGRCGSPWEVAPGLGSSQVRWAQAVLGAAILMHILSLLLLGLPAALLTARKLRHKAPWPFLVKVSAKVLPEMVLPLAVVAGFVALLFQGEVKQAVTLTSNQTEAVSWGFAVTLTGLLVTVTGVCCVVLNRYVTKHSTVAKYVAGIRPEYIDMDKTTSVRTTDPPFSTARLEVQVDTSAEAGGDQATTKRESKGEPAKVKVTATPAQSPPDRGLVTPRDGAATPNEHRVPSSHSSSSSINNPAEGSVLESRVSEDPRGPGSQQYTVKAKRERPRPGRLAPRNEAASRIEIPDPFSLPVPVAADPTDAAASEELSCVTAYPTSHFSSPSSPPTT